MPYLNIRKDPPGGKPLEGNDKYEGYVADLASEVAQRVGIDYIIQPVKDAKYGSKDDDGTWNGMIGELIRGVSSNRPSLLCSAVIKYSHHHHHHIRLFEVVKRNRQHTVQKIDVGIYMDIHTIHAGLNSFIHTVEQFLVQVHNIVLFKNLRVLLVAAK